MSLPRIKKTLLIITTGALFAAAACGGTEDDLYLDNSENGLINGTGTTLGYTCTTTLDGTTCECNPHVTDPFDKDTCHGMSQHCEDHGTTADCKSTPGKCTCSYSSLVAPIKRTIQDLDLALK
jgi:hypothetical protein